MPKQNKFKIIFDEGKKKLDKDFDLMKIIKDVKYLKMLTKFTLNPKDEIKIQIHHCLKNLIDFDEILTHHGLIQNKSIF